MRHDLLFACLLIAFFGISAFGQTAAEMESKYGPPVKAFEVRPGVLMTVKYADDGQVCEMVLERRHTTESGVNLDSTLSDKLVNELIDELAPVAVRGERKDKAYLNGKFYFETTISGSLSITERNYEHVTIEIVGSVSKGGGYMVLIIKRNQNPCSPQ